MAVVRAFASRDEDWAGVEGWLSFVQGLRYQFPANAHNRAWQIQIGIDLYAEKDRPTGRAIKALRVLLADLRREGDGFDSSAYSRGRGNPRAIARGHTLGRLRDAGVTEPKDCSALFDAAYAAKWK